MQSSTRWCLYPPLVRHVRLASNAPRRGRNLTERYRRLENAARVRSGHAALPSQGSAKLQSYRPALTPATANTIAGFVIPKEPRPPADDECCMSGCAVCVYDLYEDALTAYKDSVRTLRTSLVALDIPESEWPSHICTARASSTSATTEKGRGTVLDAFEEIERALREKRDKRAAVEAEEGARGDVVMRDAEQAGLDLHGVYEGIRWILFPNR